MKKTRTFIKRDEHWEDELIGLILFTGIAIARDNNNNNGAGSEKGLTILTLVLDIHVNDVFFSSK
jgi:hypothetical protein